MSDAAASERSVLVVEDDDAIATGLALNLKLANHATTIARDGDEAVKLAEGEDFDLVLLDMNLPKRDGLEVLAALRAADNFVPVIVLSARDGEGDKVAALRLGADDYVTKPFALAELLARIDAVLRRAAQPPPPPLPLPSELVPGDCKLGFGAVTIDCAQRVVLRDGACMKFTHIEFELLVFLVRHPNQVFSRPYLLKSIWRQQAGTIRTVDNFIGQLRKHLEVNPEKPRHLITVRGSGYRFDP